jgi:uncharacterized protein YhhL (DUF1145 family)
MLGVWTALIVLIIYRYTQPLENFPHSSTAFLAPMMHLIEVLHVG